MNPVLLKPEADTRSQVVVDGVARRDLTEMPWRDRGPHLWPAMADGVRQPACRPRARRHRGGRQPGRDQPARPRQQPDARPCRRRRAARLRHRPRRGVRPPLRHLGARARRDPRAAGRLRAQQVPRRRDAARARPDPAHRADRHGRRRHAADARPRPARRRGRHRPRRPRGTAPPPSPSSATRTRPNLDELHALAHVAHVRFATGPADLHGCDVVVLPGSKHVAADIAWLRSRGLRHRAPRRGRRGGQRILGVCGGAMLLGRQIVDPAASRAPPRGSGCCRSTRSCTRPS